MIMFQKPHSTKVVAQLSLKLSLRRMTKSEKHRVLKKPPSKPIIKGSSCPQRPPSTALGDLVITYTHLKIINIQSQITSKAVRLSVTHLHTRPIRYTGTSTRLFTPSSHQNLVIVKDSHFTGMLSRGLGYLSQSPIGTNLFHNLIDNQTFLVGLIAAHHTQPPQSFPSEADLENQVQRNLQATLQAHISPNFGNSQSTHSSTHDPAPRGYLRWNDQLRVWEPWQVEKYDPNAPEPVVDHGKLWEDIDRDIVDVVHNEVVRLPQENELIKQDDLLPHNHQPLKESYPSFYDSHSSSIPVVSPKKSDSNILSDESDSQDLQNGIKEKELKKIQVDPQSTDVKVETPDSPNSLDDRNSVVADNHTPSQNEESILKSEDLQPIKRFNSLFQDKQQALTTPTSNPTAWPSLRPSRIKGANKEAHRLVYSQALTT
ncbi:hypothetical protein DFH28DRAFT_943320 [Melampsora americana]|nr:hypothetical protein DFH28DRAFT_943320 [Melampsora americana]